MMQLMLMTMSPLLAAARPKPTFWELTTGSVAGLSVRYFLFAGVAWVLGYWLFKKPWFRRKIIAKFPQGAEVRREIGYSLLSIVIFGVVSAFTVYAIREGWTQVYRKMDRHSMLWFWLSIGCAIVIHDTWFYWTHRMMHHRRLFRLFHRVHHLSHNPTPWAAYSFAPLEAVVQALIFPIVIMVLPMHLYAFGLFMLWQISFNILGHSGYEIHPRWFMRTPLRYILNTPTNHIMHHEKMRGNYGLYFNVWDRLMGTNHEEYEKRFEEVTSGTQRGNAAGAPAVRPEPAPPASAG